MKCRHCKYEVNQPFLDLGASPPSNAYLTIDGLSLPETYFPLRVLVCEKCWLVQTEDFARAEELFSRDYAYFSSVSHTWLNHASKYTDMIRRRLSLDHRSFVVEIAANDGYLLKNFVASNIPCLGVEPTESTAARAEAIGIPIRREFFGMQLAKGLAAEGKQADLVIGNKELIRHNQFDTIYHEHFSYLSLTSVSRIFKSVGLRIWDVDKLVTHGGSLRIYGCHHDDPRADADAVRLILDEEAGDGLHDLSLYRTFQARADRVKNDLVSFLIERKHAGMSVAAYGAAAKGNTLLNYGGVKIDLLPYVCDASPWKQGKYLPGTRIPILDPAIIRQRKPDYVVILPWNIADEVTNELSYVREWGARFVVAVPRLTEIA